MEYLVFDARYNYNPDRAIVMLVADSKKEAEEYAKDYPGSVIKKMKKNKLI